MADGDEHSVTGWIADLRAGDLAALQPIWERYFERLVRTARARLKPRGYVDGEDVALSAFDSFCHAVEGGRFPQVGDRNDLWRFLIFITAQKISKVITRENAVIHGGAVSHVDGSVLTRVIGDEPSPELAAEVTEEFRRMMDALGDETLRRIAIWRMEGYTIEEIATRLNCSMKTVTNKLRLIRMKLEKVSHER
jgi:DNA-directed RNA polymerase specialized sigma24 family protein